MDSDLQEVGSGTNRLLTVSSSTFRRGHTYCARFCAKHQQIRKSGQSTSGSAMRATNSDTRRLRARPCTFPQAVPSCDSWPKCAGIGWRDSSRRVLAWKRKSEETLRARRAYAEMRFKGVIGRAFTNI